MTERIKILLLVAAIVLVYGNTLWNGFTQDDAIYVTGNPQVTQPSLKNLLSPNETTGVFRPLTFATLALNAKLTGMSPIGFHAFNLTLHAVVTVLLYLLLRALPLKPVVALMAAWLFAVHPIHTEAVAAIVGRAELLAAGLVFAAWLFHLRDREVPALACFTLALFSKESAVVFLLLAPFGDLVRGQWKPLARYGRIVATTIIFMAILWSASGNRFGPGRASMLDNPLAWLPPLWRILNALKIAAMYIGLLLYPARLSCDYSFNQIPLTTSWTAVLPALIGAAAVLALWLWAIVRKRQALALALGIYVLGFAITSNIIVAIGTIFGERLAYLPSAGFCLLIALLCERISNRRVVAVALAVIIAALSARTIVRNRDWHDNVTLYSSAVATTPESARSHASLGEQYMKHQGHGAALDEYLKALAIYPDYVDALANGAVLEYHAGNRTVAEVMMERALTLARRDDVNYDYTMVNLAALLMETGRDERALQILNRTITESPKYSRAWSNRAVIRFKRGDREGARSDADSALALDSKNTQAHAVLKLLGVF